MTKLRCFKLWKCITVCHFQIFTHNCNVIHLLVLWWLKITNWVPTFETTTREKHRMNLRIWWAQFLFSAFHNRQAGTPKNRSSRKCKGHICPSCERKRVQLSKQCRSDCCTNCKRRLIVEEKNSCGDLRRNAVVQTPRATIRLSAAGFSALSIELIRLN